MAYNEKTNKSGEDLANSIITKSNAAFTSQERVNIEKVWAELAEFILPSQNAKFMGDTTKGDKKSQRAYDSTAQIACRDLASSFHSTVTNPAAKWSKIRFKETKLNNLYEANAWCSHATNEIHNALNDSNFDMQIGRGYQSLCGLGTMVLLQDEKYTANQFKGFSFAAWHLSEVAYCENEWGDVDTIYRRFKLTLKQAYEKFGDEIGDEAKLKMEKSPNEELDFIHAIYKRDLSGKKNTLGLSNPKERPWASVYLMKKGCKIVKEDGYYYFPVYVSRWLTLPGEVYGWGPGHLCIADVRTISVINRQLLKGLGKAIDPIIFQERDNILTGDMRPGKLVSVRNINGIKEGITQSRFDIGFMQAKDLRDSIKAAFYIDKLILPPRTETGEMTAYEIQQRLEQMQIVVGPPLTRIGYETQQPLVLNTLFTLMRHGRIPPIPQSVLDESDDPLTRQGNPDLEIGFVNSLAQSQQMSELRNISAWVQEVAGVAQLKPEVLDNVDADEVVEKMARIRNIPEELVVSEKQVDAVRQQRKQQQQAQAALQAGESIGKTAKDLGSIQPGRVQ